MGESHRYGRLFTSYQAPQWLIFCLGLATKYKYKYKVDSFGVEKCWNLRWNHVFFFSGSRQSVFGWLWISMRKGELIFWAAPLNGLTVVHTARIDTSPLFVDTHTPPTISSRPIEYPAGRTNNPQSLQRSLCTTQVAAQCYISCITMKHPPTPHHMFLKKMKT